MRVIMTGLSAAILSVRCVFAAQSTSITAGLRPGAPLGARDNPDISIVADAPQFDVKLGPVAWSNPVYARELSEVSVELPAASVQAPMTVVGRLDKDVFEVEGGPVAGVLKANATEEEGAVQRKARRILREAGIGNVSVPKVLGEWEWSRASSLEIIPQEAWDAREPERHFLLMEKAAGVSLGEFGVEKIPARELLGLKKALRALHEEGVSHGDLDFPNILVTRRAGRTYFSLIDWEYGSLRAGPKRRARDRAYLRRILMGMQSSAID